MVKFPTSYLPLLSSLLFLLSACSPGKKIELSNLPAQCKKASLQAIHNATYRTQIDFYGKHLSGLLVFKSTDDTTKHAVFITETGFKFFDFQFTPATFSVPYCLPKMNKKVVINTFREDLGLLLAVHDENPTAIYKKDSIITVTFASPKNGNYFYTLAPDCKGITKAWSGGKGYKKQLVSFEGWKKENFEKIDIVHHNINLRIALKQID